MVHQAQKQVYGQSITKNPLKTQEQYWDWTPPTSQLVEELPKVHLSTFGICKLIHLSPWIQTPPPWDLSVLTAKVQLHSLPSVHSESPTNSWQSYGYRAKHVGKTKEVERTLQLASAEDALGELSIWICIHGISARLKYRSQSSLQKSIKCASLHTCKLHDEEAKTDDIASRPGLGRWCYYDVVGESPWILLGVVSESFAN